MSSTIVGLLFLLCLAAIVAGFALISLPAALIAGGSLGLASLIAHERHTPVGDGR